MKVLTTAHTPEMTKHIREDKSWFSTDAHLRRLRAISEFHKPVKGYRNTAAMTARNAVASTFSMRGEEYEPSIQT